jgi:hypothetical protein
MADNEKDRWGDKLRDNEHAREEQYFAERERELLAKLRKRFQEQGEAAGEPRPAVAGEPRPAVAGEPRPAVAGEPKPAPADEKKGNG